MKKYRIEAKMQLNIFNGIRVISAYAVYVKPNGNDVDYSSLLLARYKHNDRRNKHYSKMLS